MRVDTPTNIAASLRLLLRWIEHEGGLAHTGGRAKLDDIAEAAGVSRPKLNRFLGQELSLDTEAQRAEEIATALRPLLEGKRDVPPPVGRLMEDLYGPRDDPAVGAVVSDPAVLRHRSMIGDTGLSGDHATPLFGLSVLMRQSNELVKVADSEGQSGEERGWSLALLNLPPLHVQQGQYHPIFKLRQMGKSGHPLISDGIALVRGDRLILQGVDERERKSLTATVALPTDDELKTYPDGGVALPGAMLGLSSSRATFGCLFNLFAVPGSYVSETATAAEKKRFAMLYEAAKAAAGVRNMTDTLKVLQSLKVKATEAHLIRLRDRGEDGPLLTLF